MLNSNWVIFRFHSLQLIFLFQSLFHSIKSQLQMGLIDAKYMMTKDHKKQATKMIQKACIHNSRYVDEDSPRVIQKELFLWCPFQTYFYIPMLPFDLYTWCFFHLQRLHCTQVLDFMSKRRFSCRSMGPLVCSQWLFQLRERLHLCRLNRQSCLMFQLPCQHTQFRKFCLQGSRKWRFHRNHFHSSFRNNN